MRTLLLSRMILLWFCGLSLHASAQFYNGAQMTFGKNRIQYQPQEWQFYRYPKYDVFFYAGEKDRSHWIAREAEKELSLLEKRFGYALETRFRILIFNRLSDLKQSNLGTLPDTDDNLGGNLRRVGNKILLYEETGSRAIQKQLKAGIASVFVNELLEGHQLKDRIRSNALPELPDWFEKGITSWLSDSWNAENTGMLRDLYMSNQLRKLHRLEGEASRLAGWALWTYIASTYGEKVVPDLLVATRENRGVEGGLRDALGLSQKALIQEWLNALDRIFYGKESPMPEMKTVQGKAQRGRSFHQLCWSPDGKRLAWVRNTFGKIEIWVLDVEQGKRTRIARLGRKLPDIKDESSPALCWHPTGEYLLYTHESKGKLWLCFYNLESRQTESKFLQGLDKLSGMSLSADGRKIACTGIANGRSDLFIFNNVANTLEALTSDFWDERDVRWMPDNEHLIFSSNRLGDSLHLAEFESGLGSDDFDLFLIPSSGKPKVVQRLQRSPDASETEVWPLDKGTLTYLSTEGGHRQRMWARFDSTIAYIDTSIHYRYFLNSRPLSQYPRPILEHAVHPSGRVAELLYWNGIFRIHWMDQHWDAAPIAPLAPAPSLQQLKAPPSNVVADTVKSRIPMRRIYVFGGDAGSNRNVVAAPLYVSEDTFKISRQRVYETAWYPEMLSTRIDRSFLQQTYQPYAATGYFNPPVNGLFRLALADLFENLRITGGIRLSGNLTGNEYLLAFQNLKRRADHTLVLHRQGIQTAQSTGSRTLMHSAGYTWKYVLSPVSRITAGFTGRYDHTQYLSTDLANLQRSATGTPWMLMKAEWIYDSSFPESVNLLSGSRMKVTVEHIRNPLESKQQTTVIGADLRHYVRLGREWMAAFRAAGASSMGQGKVLYYLGGADQWFFPKFDQSVSVGTANYVFQALGTPVRGFWQNIRNGNSFAVVNAEVRWNFMRSVSRYPLRNQFLNTLQIVGLGDGGTAFTGSSPFSDANTFNQKTIVNGPITITLKNQDNPIVYGFGAGLRGDVLSYRVRVDYAWGILDGRRMPGIFYLSLCNDF